MEDGGRRVNENTAVLVSSGRDRSPPPSTVYLQQQTMYDDPTETITRKEESSRLCCHQHNKTPWVLFSRKKAFSHNNPNTHNSSSPSLHNTPSVHVFFGLWSVGTRHTEESERQPWLKVRVGNGSWGPFLISAQCVSEANFPLISFSRPKKSTN